MSHVTDEPTVWPYIENLNGYIHFKFAHLLKLSKVDMMDPSLSIKLYTDGSTECECGP